MTKAIWVLIVLVVGYLGYLLFLQWEKAKGDDAARQKEAAAQVINGDTLVGMPYQLETSFRNARQQGPVALQTWFKANEAQLADPRKAWIQLELAVLMTRENPAEAKRIYAAVKGRVPPSSPVYPKVQELERTLGQ